MMGVSYAKFKLTKSDEELQKIKYYSHSILELFSDSIEAQRVRIVLKSLKIKI